LGVNLYQGQDARSHKGKLLKNLTRRKNKTEILKQTAVSIIIHRVPSSNNRVQD